MLSLAMTSGNITVTDHNIAQTFLSTLNTILGLATAGGNVTVTEHNIAQPFLLTLNTILGLAMASGNATVTDHNIARLWNVIQFLYIVTSLVTIVDHE